MRQRLGWLGIVVLGAAAVSAPLSGQESATTEATDGTSEIAPGSWWVGMGLTDLKGDEAAPGSWAEVGAEVRLFRFLTLGISGSYAEIDVRGQCDIGDIGIECLEDKGVASVAIGPRVYAVRGPVGALYGFGEAGLQSAGLGRFGEVGYGVQFNAWENLAVSIEARHRYGWGDQEGAGQVWLVRFVNKLGRNSGK